MSTRRIHVGIHVGSLVLGAHGGTDVYKHELVEAVARYGFRNHYTFMLNAGADIPTGRYPDNVCFRRVEPSRVDDLFSHLKWMLARRFRARCADLVSFLLAKRAESFARHLDVDILHFPKTIIPCEYLGVKEKCILTYFDMQHEFHQEFFGPENLKLLRKIHRLSIERADRIIVPSTFTAGTLTDKYAVPKKKITYLPVGVWSSDVRLPKDQIEAVHRKYGLPSRYIFYPANPWPHKNHTVLIEALRIYNQKYKEEISLVLTGRLKDSPRNAYSLAVAAGLGRQVLDLGFVPKDDLAAINSGAGAMVFPSLFEGFGMPLLEAMSCGCPVAAASVTSIPEVTGDAALLFDPAKPEEIAECIHRILSDRVFAADLVSKGHKRAGSYLWSSVIPKMEDIYFEVSQIG